MSDKRNRKGYGTMVTYKVTAKDRKKPVEDIKPTGRKVADKAGKFTKKIRKLRAAKRGDTPEFREHMAKERKKQKARIKREAKVKRRDESVSSGDEVVKYKRIKRDGSVVEGVKSPIR